MSVIVKERSNVLNVEVSKKTDRRNVNGNGETLELKRGDLVFVDLGTPTGSVQGGVRVAVVISNNKANLHSGVICIAPLTSKMTKRPLPTHVLLKVSDTNKLKCPSIVLGEQLTSIGKESIKFKTGGRLTNEEMKQVEKAMMIQLGLM